MVAAVAAAAIATTTRPLMTGSTAGGTRGKTWMVHKHPARTAERSRAARSRDTDPFALLSLPQGRPGRPRPNRLARTTPRDVSEVRCANPRQQGNRQRSARGGVRGMGNRSTQKKMAICAACSRRVGPHARREGVGEAGRVGMNEESTAR